jgi:hypothetical protein
MGSRRLGVKRLNALALQGQGVTNDIGPGVSGSVGHRKIMKNGNEITTELYIDLGAAAAPMQQPGTQNLVIGNGNTGENAFLTQVTTAENGVVTLLEMTCVEEPTGGDADIDLSYSANKVGFSGSSGITQLIDGGTQVIGAEGADLLDNNVLANKYLYITTGAATDNAPAATYTAGKFLIRLYGHAVPDDV